MDQEQKSKKTVESATAKAAEKETLEKTEADVKQDKVDIQELIDKAKTKGSLSNKEILAAINDADYDVDQMDKLYEAIDKNNLALKYGTESPLEYAEALGAVGDAIADMTGNSPSMAWIEEYKDEI